MGTKDSKEAAPADQPATEAASESKPAPTAAPAAAAPQAPAAAAAPEKAAAAAPEAAAPASTAAAAASADAPAAPAATTEHPEKKRMEVMAKHLKEHFADNEDHSKQWMFHFGVSAEGDITNKKRHDAAVAGFVGAVDEEGNVVDKEKFAAACEKIKEKAAKAKDKTKGKGTAPAKNAKVCIRNLHEDTTVDKLKELFQSCGTIVRTDLKTKEGGKCKGLAFVLYTSAEEASKAMAEMHDKEVEGKKLVVTLAFDSQDKGADGKGQAQGKDAKGKGKGKGKKGIPSASNDQVAYNAMQAQAQQQMGWYAMQMQMQMMAQWQMQQGWYAQQAAATQSSAAAGASWAGGQTVYDGEVKRIAAKNGYGFISCDALKGQWADEKNKEGRDIYADIKLIPQESQKIGVKVQFTLGFNSKGHPQATQIVAA